MAKILAVMMQLPGEGNLDFRARCGRFVLHEAYGAVPDGAVAITRATVSSDPAGLRPDMTWGLAHGDAELSSDTCIIASYDRIEADMDVLPVDLQDLGTAPVNPQILPRHACRMTLREFALEAQVKDLGPGHGRQWEVFLDGVSLGFADGPSNEALRSVHRREVNNALCRMLNPDVPGAAGWVLPTPGAVGSHLEFLSRKGFEVPIATVNQAHAWRGDAVAAAAAEGWGLFETENGLELQTTVEISPVFDGQVEAVVWEGIEPHHMLARTVLYVQNPFEYARVRQSAHLTAEMERSRPVVCVSER